MCLSILRRRATIRERVFGALDEVRSADNRGVLSLDVNEFTLQPESELTCASLDGVFEAFFTVGSLKLATLSVGSFEAPISSQPDLKFVPILSRPVRQTHFFVKVPVPFKLMKISVPSNVVQPDQPVEVRFRFEHDFLQDQFNLQSEDANNQDDVASKMGIYTWRKQTKSWKQLPSKNSLSGKWKSTSGEILNTSTEKK